MPYKADTLKDWAYDGFVQMLVDDHIPALKADLYIKPGYATAAWRFRPPHSIVLGDGMFERMADKPFTQQHHRNYFLAYLRHELAHALWTEPDTPKLSAKLAEMGIPFRLYNLFEDARIEERMRTTFKKPFNWLTYEAMPQADDPLSLFFFLLQSEHAKPHMAHLAKTLSGDLRDEFKRVLEFYKRVCEAESSWELLPIMQEWLETYPLEESASGGSGESSEAGGEGGEGEGESGGESGGPLDALASGRLFGDESAHTESGEAFEELLEGAELASDQGSDGDSRPPKTKADRRFIAGPGSLLRQAQESSTLQQDREMLEQMLMTLFVQKRRYKSHNPSRKLNRRAFIDDDQPLYVRHYESKGGHKNITLVVDLSGSMGACFHQMRLIIETLNTLAHRGHVRGWVVLSGVHNAEALCEEHRFPLEDTTIEQMVPQYEAEGLANALEKSFNRLLQSDYVWVLTDGAINDEPIDRARFNRAGIRIGGVYLGDKSTEVYMKRWFDYVICEPDLQTLGKRLLEAIAQKGEKQ